jgi:hypothetical protein
MMDFNQKLKLNNIKSQKQEDNWVTNDEIKSILEKNKVNYNNKKELNEVEYKKLLKYFVLCLYIYNEPRRNKDYQLNYLVNEYTDDLPTDINYTDYKNKNFIFENFKTSKTYNKQIIPINENLYNIMNEYLRFHPLIKQFEAGNYIPLLVDYNGSPLKNINSITRILNNIFEKNIGSSMLRNINLTNKYGTILNQLNESSKNMGTSIDTALHTYIKIK